MEAVEGSLVYLGAQYGAVVTKSDDRGREKAAVGALCAGPSLAGLAEDGRAYREELRAEIGRLSRCVGAEREGASLLEALGAADAARLKGLLEEYQARFDALFPPLEPPALPAAGRRAGAPLQLLP